MSIENSLWQERKKKVKNVPIIKLLAVAVNTYVERMVNDTILFYLTLFFSASIHVQWFEVPVYVYMVRFESNI